MSIMFQSLERQKPFLIDKTLPRYKFNLEYSKRTRLGFNYASFVYFEPILPNATEFQHRRRLLWGFAERGYEFWLSANVVFCKTKELSDYFNKIIVVQW